MDAVGTRYSMYPVRGIAVQAIYNMMSRPTPECIPGAGIYSERGLCTRASRTAYGYRMILLPAQGSMLRRVYVRVVSLKESVSFHRFHWHQASKASKF